VNSQFTRNVAIPEPPYSILRSDNNNNNNNKGWLGMAALAAVTGVAAATLPRMHKKQRCRSARVVRLAGQAENDNETSKLQMSFPFSAVVGQEDMKLALLLNLIDPSIGGAMIIGDRGTGKSTAVRALERLLPEIAVVAEDKYNSDPNDVSSMSDEARARLAAGEELPVVMRRTPFVELPLGATEDRVTGTIDIEAALLEGGKAFEPGILARVNRGILYIDEVNLLDDQLVDVLLDSAAGGWNTVEREGVSVRHPARFLLVGTAHPDEGDLRPQLLDRFGMTVPIRTMNDAESRLQVLQRSSQWARNPGKLNAQFADEDAKLKAKILEARDKLSSVSVPRDLRLRISSLCSALNVDGLRGDIVVNRAARALAAFEDRTELTDEDVRRVAVMCLQHRLRKDVVSDDVDNSTRVVEALIREFGQGPPVAKQPEENVMA